MSQGSGACGTSRQKRDDVERQGCRSQTGKITEDLDLRGAQVSFQTPWQSHGQSSWKGRREARVRSVTVTRTVAATATPEMTEGP